MGKASRPALAVVSVQWCNPHREPPEGAPRVLWACTVLDRAYEAEILAHAPSCQPGSGYSPTFTAITPPPRRFTPERKAKIRIRNLRDRLARQVPLFADEYFEQEVTRRPGYFAGRDPGLD
jgi:hypothetical protein